MKHDKGLLRAVSEQGLSYLKLLKENEQYGFENMRVPSKRLQKRVEFLCLFFKDNLTKFKKPPVTQFPASIPGGNLSTGQTQIDPQKKFTKINVERDEDGNIRYPIYVSPTLSILSLGEVEYERQAYHSSKNIFPIGFKSLREYTSMTKEKERAQYICEILDGGATPLFKVTSSEEPNNPIQRDSSSGVWVSLYFLQLLLD